MTVKSIDERLALREGEEEVLSKLRRVHEQAIRQVSAHLRAGLKEQRQQDIAVLDSSREAILQRMTSQMNAMQEDFAESEHALLGRVRALSAEVQSWRGRAESAEQQMSGADVDTKATLETAKQNNEKLKEVSLQRYLPCCV